MRGTTSTDETEERAHLVHEQFWLLERGEVAASFGLVPVPDIDEPFLRPSTGWTLELLREDRAPSGNVDDVSDRARDPLVHLPDALPVQPCGGRAGPREPIEHQVVEELVACEHVLEVTIVVRPRTRTSR